MRSEEEEERRGLSEGGGNGPFGCVSLCGGGAVGSGRTNSRAEQPAAERIVDRARCVAAQISQADLLLALQSLSIPLSGPPFLSLPSTCGAFGIDLFCSHPFLGSHEAHVVFGGRDERLLVLDPKPPQWLPHCALGDVRLGALDEAIVG